MRLTRYLAIVVLLLGVVGIAMGAVFISLGVAKNNQLVEALRLEQVTLGMEENVTAEGNVIDTAEETQAAGDTIREHRRNIALTYEELLGGERFDPTNPQHLSYAQALNMENYLYLAVVGFGLINVVIASGAFMVVTGFALGGTGLVLYQLGGRLS